MNVDLKRFVYCWTRTIRVGCMRQDEGQPIGNHISAESIEALLRAGDVAAMPRREIEEQAAGQAGTGVSKNPLAMRRRMRHGQPPTPAEAMEKYLAPA